MDAVNEEQVEEIVYIKCTQVGGTEIILNTIGYFIHQDPSPILNVNPTKQMAETFSLDRFSTMIRDTPVLREIVTDQELAKKSSNTILRKSFPGGHFTMASASSPTQLASRPVRILIFDELDQYKNTKQGDPMKIGVRRTSEYWNRKILYTSSPLELETSRIDKKFKASDQRHYHVPCPKCGVFQKLEWKQVKWKKDEKGNIIDVHYECAHCEAHLLEHDKGRMIRNGEWRKENPGVKKIAGFHINTLYSLSTSWEDVVQAFEDARHNPSDLKTWVNTYLGQAWEEQATVKIEVEDLFARREAYEDIPMSVCFLTASVDVQDDRLECLVKGWTVGEESWVINRRTFLGSPGREDIWQDLMDHLLKPYKHESGLELRIQATCIDSGGHFTSQVYTFCKKNVSNRFFAIKGMGGYGKLFIGKVSRNNKQRVALIPLGVDSAKELIYDRLQIEEPGRGYMHFNEQCDEEYFKQLTVERQVTKYIKGFPSKVWKKPEGKRNEALDLEVYAYAALKIVNPDMKAFYERLIKDIGALEREGKKALPPAPVSKQPGAQRARGAWWRNRR